MNSNSLRRTGLAILAAAGQSLAAPAFDAHVSAGRHSRVDFLVTMNVPDSHRDVRVWDVVESSGGRAVKAQLWFDGSKPRLSWRVAGRLPAGAEMRFVVKPGDGKPMANPPLQCVDDGRRLILRVGEQPLVQYNHALVESPPGIEAVYRRSGHLHPLFTPNGLEVTGDFPPDHAHQHGVFYPWVRTKFRGRPVDFWNQKGGTGMIGHSAVLERISGPVFAGFNVVLTHRALFGNGGSEAVLSESWAVRAGRFQGVNVVDLESWRTNLTDAPLQIEKYHYGGMAVRGNHQWFDEKMAARITKMTRENAGDDALRALHPPRDFLTSEGKTWVDGNTTRARWVIMHGNIDGKPAGVAVLCHPENFRAPQPVRLHPSKPYFCFAPMALGGFEIKPAGIHRSRYRFLAFDGPVDAKRIETLWLDYAEPVEVTVTGGK